MAQVPATIDPNLADGLATEERRQRPHRVPARVRQLDGTTRRVAQPLGLPETEWRTALQTALGTTSQAFVEASLQRLIAAAMLPGEPVGTTLSVSAALALVQEPGARERGAGGLSHQCCLPSCGERQRDEPLEHRRQRQARRDACNGGVTPGASLP